MKFQNQGRAIALVIALSAGSTGGSALAQITPFAAATSESTAKPSKKKKSAKTSSASGGAGSGSVKFLPGSEETRSQRATRLKRECKGRVNAGACEGYAS